MASTGFASDSSGKEKMIVNKNDQIVEWDIDDTLVIWHHPNPDLKINGVPCKIHTIHIDSIKRFHARGQYVIVWSDGGWAWAHTVVKALGLEAYVDEVRSKSKWHFDDKPQSEWNTVRCYNNLDEHTNVHVESNKSY